MTIGDIMVQRPSARSSDADVGLETDAESYDLTMDFRSVRGLGSRLLF